MSKELTYILGAGASFQSIPIVKTFPSRFLSFNGYVSEIFNDSRFEDEKKEAFRKLYEKCDMLYNDFLAHQSFDTYFKKLFHTNQIKKINEAKKILNLYFIWEHLSPPSAVKPKSEGVFWKQAKIDKRYDALIAGLLKSLCGKSETYCPVNFITWNYDMNLLMSLKNYYSPNESYDSFLEKINTENGTWQIGKSVSIINMNGYFHSSHLSFLPEINILQNNNIEIHDILFEKITGKTFISDEIDPDSDLIKFAWESSSHSNVKDLYSVIEAQEKVKESNNIVVIGYTFPLYNRLIDLEYFNRSSLLNKNVYIQDPNALEIKALLVSDFNLTEDYSPSPYLKEISNCDSFFVPSNIFKYKDSMEIL